MGQPVGRTAVPEADLSACLPQPWGAVDAASLADTLIAAGALDPAWRTAFLRAPRDAFVPDRIFLRDGNTYRALRRHDDPTRWWSAVHTDTALVTQVEDGADVLVSRYPSSATSQPTIVARMLRALDVRQGHRVLEIGTGTGWNAGLLAAHLGPDAVVSVETDRKIADAARSSLRRLRLPVEVVTGDGTEGFADRGPYDGLIATCAVHTIPQAWIDQTAPGGVIVTPWGSAFHNGVLLRLVVVGDGSAVGRVVDDAAFMWLRGQRPATRDVMSLVHDQDEARRTRSVLDPRALLAEDAAFAVGLQSPGLLRTVGWGSGDEADECTVWLADAASGSWASADYVPGRDTYEVEQYGARRLWDEAVAAYRGWQRWGSPSRLRFGVTVDGGRTLVWVDEPQNVVVEQG